MTPASVCGRFRVKTAALIALAVTLSSAPGCRVDQAEEVAIYRRLVDLAPAALDDSRPLTLRDALLLANQNNEQLAVQGEEYLQALIDRRRAVANFLPTIDLIGTHSRGERVSGSDSTSTNVLADLELNLFNGFEDLNAYWRDTFLAIEQRNNLLAFQESLLLDVARVYYQILRSEELVRVLENSLALQEERLRDARARFEVGTAPPLDVAQTEAQVSATRTTLIDARRNVADARQLLALLTGVPVAEVPLADVYSPPEQISQAGEYVQIAAVERKDLAAAVAAKSAARRDVAVAWGQYYPSVSLNLEAFLHRESVPDERDWTALLSANVPIFSAGRIHQDVREAWSFFRQALLVHSYLERQVVQEVRSAHLLLVASRDRLRELRVQVQAAEQAFTLADASYRVGRATNLDRIAAQNALLSAQLQLANEQFDGEILYLDLLRAAGVLRREVEQMTLVLQDGPPAPPAPPDRVSAPDDASERG